MPMFLLKWEDREMAFWVDGLGWEEEEEEALKNLKAHFPLHE